MKKRKRVRLYLMGRCPACRRLHRVPLEADPTKVECKKCFWGSIQESLRKFAAWAAEAKERAK